jgi:hypothetical protein
MFDNVLPHGGQFGRRSTLAVQPLHVLDGEFDLVGVIVGSSSFVVSFLLAQAVGDFVELMLSVLKVSDLLADGVRGVERS